MELYASCRQVRTPLRRLCLGVLEKLPLLRDRFFAGLLTVGGPALGVEMQGRLTRHAYLL